MSEVVQVVFIERGASAESEETYTVENPVGVVTLPDGAVIVLDPLAPADEVWTPK